VSNDTIPPAIQTRILQFGGLALRVPVRDEKSREQALEEERDFYKGRLDLALKEPKMNTRILEIVGDVIHLDAGQGRTIELPFPAEDYGLEVGDKVKVLQGHGIIGKVENELPVGPIALVKQCIDERVCEVQIQMQALALPFRGKPPRPGDRVVIDREMTCVLKNLGAGDTSRNVSQETGVEWDDVGGQEEAKRALREAIEEPILKPGVYKRFGIRPPRGVLLHGEPGNGKTMLGKAAATALHRLHNERRKQLAIDAGLDEPAPLPFAASGFIYVKGPELLDKFVGETESNIRRLFAQAREHNAISGYPAVIFIDEADAILAKRGSRAPGMQGMETTVIPQFLSEMDGMFDSGAFVLLATNRPDILDGAVVRDGRIDRKVHVKKPSLQDATDILARLLAKRPTAEKAGDLAAAAARDVFASSHVLRIVRLKGESDRRFTLGDIASGAVLAGLVERATQRAIRRALDGVDKDEGIAAEDLGEAVKEIVKEQRELDQDAALRIFCEPFHDRVIGIDKAEREQGLIIVPGSNGKGILQ